ncbi:hypothetical protein [Halorubrum sp. DTA46]|uniref:hypothetical protein n=1 Tax=Halorubrum sp. DTA46 TaxID=3402162 RepID=UPI003AAC7B48
MNTHDAPRNDPDAGSGVGSDGAAPDRRFDGPWLRIMAVAAGGWTVFYGLDRFLLEAGTPAGAAVGFAHAYLLAPLVTTAILLDALSLAERGVADFGLFKWLYAFVALVVPPIAVAYYAHREWLKPGDPALLGGP